MNQQGQRLAVDVGQIEAYLTRKVVEVAQEPDYSWGNGFRSYLTDGEGGPVVRVAAVNCDPGFDIWENLRTPANVGMYPLTLSDVWMHYAASNIKSTRHDGSPNPLAMPEPYNDARGRFRRAVLLTAMLVINPEIFETYAEKISRGDQDPYDYYGRAQGEASAIINKAVGKTALALMAPDRAVVPMTGNNVARIIARTRGEYLTGRYHGPCNTHWPQNSIAVVTGMMRFGVNRLVFRDELWPDGSVRRLFGRYASLVIFDGRTPEEGGSDGMSLLDGERLARLHRINDYKDIEPDVVAQRYCPYNVTGEDGKSVCGKCITTCPSGALSNSSPRPDGSFSERVALQRHRFWEGTLDFDFGNCTRERNQKAQLYDDFVCARCEAICAVSGVRRNAREIESINR
jgi:ferredoxin